MTSKGKMYTSNSARPGQKKTTSTKSEFIFAGEASGRDGIEAGSLSY
jgi:hypothetical protein